jgi:cell shape-determining protein MreC
MLIRISLIVAILAGLAVGAINFTKIKTTITGLREDLTKQTGRADTAERNLASTKKTLDQTQNTLTQTKRDLDSTKSDLTKAVASVNDLKKQATQLQESLTTAQKELTETKIDLELYHQAFTTPQQALSVAKDMKALQDKMDVVEDEKKVLQRRLVQVQTELDVYKNPEKPIYLPANLIGQVVVTDPKWDFVVLNVGEDQGALERGELLVNRGGKLVAKVKITSVQKNRSIANIVPGWKLGEVLEGDQVIPANPASS